MKFSLFLLITVSLVCSIYWFFLEKLILIKYKYSREYHRKFKLKFSSSDDIISSFFSKYLPTPEDIGLTRYDQNSRPENYPCTKTEWAVDLPQDKFDRDLLLIRQLLSKTNLEFRPLKLAFDANRDGWKASQIYRTQ
jgi:hypothetical protein